jgi:hypothetical protein
METPRREHAYHSEIVTGIRNIGIADSIALKAADVHMKFVGVMVTVQ